ncbi:response regulator transcription factor [Kibdelosporangium phytohabitans]|uniref:MerR family transcriptional regulator n=1 Tax=Kibdelosporangium phytohabitans TaxID=860235 RepID=A0A0N9HYE7_9PSEU|nr:response regulator transcription factor [Kibdelosporangium phytohabitans]ALG08354.1 hypothetical protein AOZ06_16845 [Kibdelosporangium phytohabitans]MBE1470605.1 two-component system response regulator DesR [Kibdelosporangium phytohabitans]
MAPEWKTGIHVLLVEDMTLLRDALTAVLADQSDMAVLAAMQCDDAVVQVATRLHPDIAVIDIDTHDDECGISTMRELHATLAGTRVIALVTSAPSGLLGDVLREDLPGVLDKSISAKQFTHAIRRVAHGERVIDVDIPRAILTTPTNPLTPREQQVLQEVASGASNNEIAANLWLSAGTVRNYLSRAITKTNARNRIDAVRIARAAGWLHHSSP